MLRSNAVVSSGRQPLASRGCRPQSRFKNRAMDGRKKSGGVPKVLIAASKGGHWDQMMVLRDVFAPYRIAYATTDQSLIVDTDGAKAYALRDCNRNTPLLILLSILTNFWVVLRFRPDYVVSTGALPGLFCILFGRALGAETIWVDSVANAERLSMCGRVATHVATVCLTQWEHLARPEGPSYAGSVL